MCGIGLAGFWDRSPCDWRTEQSRWCQPRNCDPRFHWQPAWRQNLAAVCPALPGSWDHHPMTRLYPSSSCRNLCSTGLWGEPGLPDFLETFLRKFSREWMIFFSHSRWMDSPQQVDGRWCTRHKSSVASLSCLAYLRLFYNNRDRVSSKAATIWCKCILDNWLICQNIQLPRYDKNNLSSL